MKNFFQTIEPLLNGLEHTAVSVNGVTYLLLACPYTQMASPPADCAFIDRYYVASNRIYFIKKELVSALRNEGYETVDCPYPYKHLAYAAKFGLPLQNTLIAHPKFGTRMAMEVIGIRGVFAPEQDEKPIFEHPPASSFCEKCGKCIQACPQKALNRNGIEPSRCTRALQECAVFPTAKSAESMGTNLWGCDICQRVCPMNAKQPETPMTESERELFCFDKLLQSFTAGKKGCEKYRDILGGNYLRPTKLLALLFRVLANTENPSDYRATAAAYLNHPDERLRSAAQALVEKCDS
ncbi:MAG TPA: hypothetical protein DDY98_06235 [Ruminococcaceae bacterium]|nr:hypothetical protein [Oscillospiraceae bacterium]